MYWLRVSVWKQCEQKIEYPGGPLAQLVEQLTLNQRAVGSTPTRPTKFLNYFRLFLFGHVNLMPDGIALT